MAMNSDFSHDTYLFCFFLLLFYFFSNASTLFTACPHTPTGLSFVQMFQKALISPSVWFFFKRTSANERSFLSQDCKYSTLLSLKSAPLNWWGAVSSSSLVQKWGFFFLFAPFQHTFLKMSLCSIVQLSVFFLHSAVCLMCSVRLTTVRFSFRASVFSPYQSCPSVRSVFLTLSPWSTAPFILSSRGHKDRVESFHPQKKRINEGQEVLKVLDSSRVEMLASDESVFYVPVRPSVYRCLEDTSKQVIIMRWALQKLTLVSSLSVMVSRASRYSRESTS